MAADLGQYLPPPSPGRGLPAGFSALAVAVACTLIAGLVSVAALTTSLTNSPRDAVGDLLRAASTGNIAGVVRTLDPPERDAISPALTAVVADLRRLGLLADNADLGGVSGLSITFSDVATRTEALGRPGLAAVVFTGGRATVHVDPSHLPLGALAKGFAARLPAVTRALSLGGRGAEDRPIVTVRRNGQWYVSLGYSTAEAARRRRGLPLPPADASVPPAGAASPAAAVEALVEAATGDDVERLVALTDPLDAAALHDYAPVLLPHRPAPAGTGVHVTDLRLATSPVRGGTLVTVTGFRATGPHGLTVSLAGRCFLIARGATSHHLCEPSGSNLLAGYGVVTVQRAGLWYVDPYRTVLDDLDQVLRGVNLTAIARLARGDPLAVLSAVVGFVGQAPVPGSIQ